MCRYCNFEKIGGEELDPDYSEGLSCDWFSHDLEEYCTRAAGYLIEYGYVEDHLCQEHTDTIKNQFRAQLKQLGRDDFQRLPFKFLQLREEHVQCDFKERGTACMKAAAFARFIESMQFFCSEHAREAGYLAAEDQSSS